MEAPAAGRSPAAPPASMPAAILGNGSLLATVSASGRVERMFWPHVDWGQHLGVLRLGAVGDGDGDVMWLDGAAFTHAQRYDDGAMVLTTRACARARGFELEVTDVVLPDEPVLLRRVVGSRDPFAIAVYCRPELDESDRYGGVYVDAARRALVFHRRQRAFALCVLPAAVLACGRADGDPGRSALHALRERVPARAIEFGAVDGVVAGRPAREHVVACAFGASPDEALALAERALVTGFDDARAARARRDAAVLADALPVQEHVPGLEALYRRSLLTIDLLSDRSTGAIIAAPEFDPEFRDSGGYGFVWARDIAFVALALLAAGRSGPAAAALRWLTRTQAAEGLWLHRHWTAGSLAPSWGLHQIDETGVAVFAFEAAWRQLRDAELDRELWPAARRAADFLCGSLDPATGLPLRSVDLWEERDGQHAYSGAAVSAGLRAAGAMARRHDPPLAA
ncbi:MAG: glycoside hydrolase family 15 protein, partial [Thermoleophilaceae bacterium]